MEFEGVIFDLDGTLLDSYISWMIVFKKAFSSMNHNMTKEEFTELYKMTYEETNEYFSKVYKESNASVPLSQIMDEIEVDISQEYSEKILAKPFAKEFVYSLHEKNIPICIATLTPTHLAKLALDRLGLTPAIQFIITGDDVGLSKKHPDIYEEAALRMGSSVKNTVVFEDSFTAIKTANRAGFKVCGVYDSYQHYSLEDIRSYCNWILSDYKNAINTVK